MRIYKGQSDIKRINKHQHEMIQNLSAGLTSARSLINDRNIQVKNLSRAVKNHELTIDILEKELHCVRQQTDEAL